MSTTGSGPYTVPNMVLGNGYRTLATGYAAYSSCPVVVLIEDTVTYAWELMLATYTAGSPGTRSHRWAMPVRSKWLPRSGNRIPKWSVSIKPASRLASGVK